MEEELRKAKVTNSDTQIRERVHAIKTMCELILEESPSTVSVDKSPTMTVTAPSMVGQAATVPNQQKRLIIDNESNGESIFDF